MIRTFLFSCVFLTFASCGGGGGSGSSSNHVAVSATGPMTSMPLRDTVDLTVDVFFSTGSGHVAFYADQDGNLATTEDRIAIGEVNGVNGRYDVPWDTNGAQPGTYQLLAVGPDGVQQTIGDPLSLIYGNVTGVSSAAVSPLSDIWLTASAVFASGDGTWDLVLDEDGDPSTTGDQLFVTSGSGDGASTVQVDASILTAASYTPVLKMIDANGASVDVVDETPIVFRRFGYHRCPLRVEGTSGTVNAYRNTGHLMPYKSATVPYGSRGYLFSLQSGETAHLMPNDGTDDVVNGPAVGSAVVFARYDDTGAQVYQHMISADTEFELTDSMFHTNNTLSITGMVNSTVDVSFPSADGNSQVLPATGGVSRDVHAWYDADGNLKWLATLDGTGTRRLLSAHELTNRQPLSAIIYEGTLTIDAGKSWQRVLPDSGIGSADFIQIRRRQTDGRMLRSAAVFTSQGRVDEARVIGGNNFKVVLLEASGDPAFSVEDGVGGTVDIAASGDEYGGLIMVYETSGVLRWVRRVSSSEPFTLRTETRPLSVNGTTRTEYFMSVTHAGDVRFEPGAPHEELWASAPTEHRVQVFPVNPDTGLIGAWRQTLHLTGGDAQTSHWATNMFRTDSTKELYVPLRVTGGAAARVGQANEIAFAADGFHYRAGAVIDRETGEVLSLNRWIRFEGGDLGYGLDPDWGDPDALDPAAVNPRYAIQVTAGFYGNAVLDPDGASPVSVSAGPSPSDFCYLDATLNEDGSLR